jgi:hypothetical protein
MYGHNGPVGVFRVDKTDRRIAPRQDIHPIEISGFTSLDHMTLLSRHGTIIDASSTGFLLHVDRVELVPKQFKNSLSLSEVEGDQILLTIREMKLEIGGKITRTKRINKETFEIAIDFSDDAPEYWRECLLEMLPRPGEMD